MEKEWVFSIGADIFCMSVCTMLCFSSILNLKGQNADTYAFVNLITNTVFALFLDELCWLVQGIPKLRVINITANVIFYSIGLVLIYLFWRYIRRALKLFDMPMKIADLFLSIMLIPSMLIGTVNFIYPLYFSVDENGVYERAIQWDVSQIYLSITLTVIVIAIVFSTASKKDKFVAISFIAIPIINQFVAINVFGLSTQYAAVAVSIVLIYGVLFADREKAMAARGAELGLATKIQANMLPDIHTFMPEKKGFDLYASMTPAKEVGGDFYDFFMIDDSHLAIVIADVSDKGIPASLFMMASKILIKNTVLTGKSPAEVLQAVNTQLCENNKETMFVTVWLGILDLDDGTLISANGGHESPIIKKPDGDFELIKTKHGFIIGAMSGIKYKENTLTLEPDTKLFVYTDGVPEAENLHEEQYGFDRFLSVLNKNKAADPKTLLSAVSADVHKFAQNRPQFDDITMLCIHYKGHP